MSTGRPRVAPDPEKLTGTRLVEEIAATLSVEPEEVRLVWEAVLLAIREAVIDGRPVVLMNVGTLDPVVRKARRCYDPSSQELVNRPRRRSVRFVPSRNLRDDL